MGRQDGPFGKAAAALITGVRPGPVVDGADMALEVARHLGGVGTHVAGEGGRVRSVGAAVLAEIVGVAVQLAADVAGEPLPAVQARLVILQAARRRAPGKSIKLIQKPDVPNCSLIHKKYR